MHHQDRGGGTELNGEITVGNGIETVAGDAGKAELFGNKFAIDVKSCPGQSSGAEGQNIDPLVEITEAFGISFQHLVIGEHVM